MSPQKRTYWDDIEKAKQLLRRRSRLLFRGLVLECYKRVVLRTPVDTGRARGNWQIAEGNPPEGDLFSYDRTGTLVIAQAAEFARTLSAEDVVYILNNLPYISALENGHSDQAPQGMVAVTMAEVQLIAAEIIRVVSAESARIAGMEASANG